MDKEFFAKFSAGSIAPFTYWIPEKLGLYCDPCVGESVNLAILSPHEINFGQGTGDQPSTNIKTIDMSTFFETPALDACPNYYELFTDQEELTPFVSEFIT